MKMFRGEQAAEKTHMLRCACCSTRANSCSCSRVRARSEFSITFHGHDHEDSALSLFEQPETRAFYQTAGDF
jgi:hypothetical protein